MKNRIRIVLKTLALAGLILSTSCASSKTPTIITNSLPEGNEEQNKNSVNYTSIGWIDSLYELRFN